MNYADAVHLTIRHDTATLTVKAERRVMVVKFKGVDVEALNEVYRTLIDVVGLENAEKLYDHYRGQQLNFPVRLFSTEYIKQTLAKEGEGCDMKLMSRNLGCSERWIKKLAKENDGSNLC